MRSIHGTVTDRATDRYIPKAATTVAAEEESMPPLLTNLTLDEYQELAATTVAYPRVYTEQQVKNMLTRAYHRSGRSDRYVLDDWIEWDLTQAETPFNRLVYPVLGLVGEAGEVANKLKKVARDDHGVMSGEKVDTLADELGDVAWYVAAVARDLRVKLGVVARSNLEKLFSRKRRGVIAGSGDDR